MEPRFGHDFSQVRVHADAVSADSAREVNALAYTVGRDVVFGAGKFAPATPEGRRLIAHELTHVVQQSGTGPKPSADGAAVDADGTLEREAEHASKTISNTQGMPQIFPSLDGASVQRQKASTASATAEKWADTVEQKSFLEAVLAAHIAKSTKTKGGPLPDLEESNLQLVSGTSVKMRTEAAIAAGNLLANANQQLAEAKTKKDEDALKTIHLSAISGYRARSHQENLWRTYFKRSDGYYERTATVRETLASGKHGKAAVDYMVIYIAPKIAAPGFSNHQAGLAIDFSQQRTKGNAIQNSTDAGAVKKWQATWFFAWLQKNAQSHNFVEYVKEPWHWTYQLTPSIGDFPAPSTTESYA